MTHRHKAIQTSRDTDIRTYRHADMRTRRHTDVRAYGRTRQRTTPDVMMTMPMDTDDIDVVTRVDDDDEKYLSLQIQRHADSITDADRHTARHSSMQRHGKKC